MKDLLFIVDANASRRQLTKHRVEQMEYRAMDFGSGQAVIQHVKHLEAHARNEILAVLLDLDLPEMDGLETLRTLLLIEPNLGVIMAAENNEDTRAQEAIHQGAFEAISKPIDFEYLQRILDALTRG